MTVFYESWTGKTVVAEVRRVRNVGLQQTHKTVSGPEDKVDATVSFGRESCSVITV